VIQLGRSRVARRGKPVTGLSADVEVIVAQP